MVTYSATTVKLSEFQLASLAGDFDLDSDVDGGDFLLWQQGGSPTSLSQSDLSDWDANYSVTTSLASAASVPEPSAWVLLLAGLAIFCAITRR